MNVPIGYHVEPSDWATDQAALRTIRDEVFVQEQHVSVEEEWDGLDPECRHVLARDDAGTPIGTGRLTPQHTIGRMAVLRDWRGRGVGAALLQALTDQARAMGWKRVSLHAQVHALGFYERHGFIAEGEPFMEAGIEHRTMTRTLDPMPDAPEDRGELHKDPESCALDTETREEVVAAVLQLFAEARHSMVIHYRDLGPGVLDHEDVLSAMRRLATSGRGADVRILLADPDRAQRDGHRLIPLAQRLTSTIQLRVPVEDDDRAYPSAFFANDTGGYLLLPLADRYEGQGAIGNSGTSRRLVRYFDEVWERAAPATVLRRLGL